MNNSVVKIEENKVGGSIFESHVIEAVSIISNKLSNSKMVPEHLQGKPDDCFLVVQQAYRWQLDPFAVAQSSSVVKGKLCYEGKLVASVLERLSGVVLDYEYSGMSLNRTVKVSGVRPNENSPRSIEIVYSQVKTANSHWQTSPDQMLAYRGAREWVRRWMPGVLLGVYTKDELEESLIPAGGGSTADPILRRLNKKKNKPKKQKPVDVSPPTEQEDKKDEFDIKAFRITKDGVTGAKQFDTLLEAAAFFNSLLWQLKTKGAREALKQENIALLKALEQNGEDIIIDRINETIEAGEPNEPAGN